MPICNGFVFNDDSRKRTNGAIMNVDVLCKDSPGLEEIREIFERFIPNDLKEQVYSHALWLESDPDLIQNDSFQDLSKQLPSWSYDTISYAYKFRDIAFDLCEAYEVEKTNVAWTNLIKSIVISGNDYVNKAWD